MTHIMTVLSNSLALCPPIVALSAPLSALALYLHVRRRRKERRKPP